MWRSPVPEASSTWIVVADGAMARIFLEVRRGGALVEMQHLEMRQKVETVRRGRHEAGTGYASKDGPAHGMESETTPHEAAEARFLADVAEMLHRKRDDYAHFILFAPPRALGVLRAELSKETAAKLELDSDLELRRETSGALRRRVRDLRLPST
jgi:protein required for attachment to host cells